MTTKDYLYLLRNKIHSTVFATLDREGRPHTRVIDIMLADENSIYFITAKGKAFYEELTAQKFVAISGMTGDDSGDIARATLEKISISLRGAVEEIGPDMLEEVFRRNPYMNEIYPDPQARMMLTVFRLSDGEGEYFDLTTKPVTRERFIVGKGLGGNKREEVHGYFITDRCRECGTCYLKCSQKCIDLSLKPPVIRQQHCLHCGTCKSVCPFDAIEKR